MDTIKRTLLFFLILALADPANGQTDYFPAVGDTMYFLVDQVPENIDVSDRGSFAHWDLSMARAPFLRPIVSVSPGDTPAGDQFPESNFALQIYDQTTEYYRKEGGELYFLGTHGFFINEQFVPVTLRYDYPLMVNDPSAGSQTEWEYESHAEITFPASMMEPGFRSLLPIAADSIRVKITLNRQTQRDAEGEIKYQILYDEAERFFSIEEYDYTFLLKMDQKPWQDFTQYVDLKKLFGEPVRYFYDFKGSASGIAVASVRLNPLTRSPKSVRYWVRSYLDRFQKASELTAPDIYAFPNPAIGFVNIELNNLKPGKYQVVLYNFLAQEVFRIPVDVISNETVQIDVSEFEKGPYLYALIDSYGRRIKTKRLTILKP